MGFHLLCSLEQSGTRELKWSSRLAMCTWVCRAKGNKQNNPSQQNRACKTVYRTSVRRQEVLQKEIDDLKETLRTKTIEVNQLSDLVKNVQLQNEIYQAQLRQFVHTSEKTTFTYKCLKKNPKPFFYMTGLYIEDFDCLFACVEPYIPAIMYPDSKSHQQRMLTEITELMCFMTVCRHTLHLVLLDTWQAPVFQLNPESLQHGLFFYWLCLIS